MCHWIYSVPNPLRTWGVPLSRRDRSFFVEGCSVRISVQIFTGKDLVFNERKEYPAIKFLAPSLAQFSLGLDLVFMGFLICLCFNSKDDNKCISTGKEHKVLNAVS